MGLLSKAAGIAGNVVSNGAVEPAAPGTGGIAALIEEYHHHTPSFHCLVLAADAADVAAMAAHFAAVHALDGGNCLVLFPGDMDGALIAHRLSLSLKTKTLVQFQGDSPAGALAVLAPYL
jgi:hypothetical protein